MTSCILWFSRRASAWETDVWKKRLKRAWTKNEYIRAQKSRHVALERDTKGDTAHVRSGHGKMKLTTTKLTEHRLIRKSLVIAGPFIGQPDSLKVHPKHNPERICPNDYEEEGNRVLIHTSQICYLAPSHTVSEQSKKCR
jgi:hypothetical protein